MTRRTAAQAVLTMLLLGLVFVPSALAKGGPPLNSPTSSLSLVSEYINWPNAWEPNCVTETASDLRNFAGALNGSYSTSHQLCGLDTDGATAGGEGLIATVAVVGSLGDLTITARTERCTTRGHEFPPF